MPGSSTPPAITPEIEALCAELAPGSVPTFVPHKAIPSTAEMNCFIDVAARVKAEGGSSVLGWAVWEWPGRLLEAELHAVWRAPNGDCVDITPRQKAISSVLFLPDPAREYNGRQVNSVRKALRDHPAIRSLFETQDRLFEFMNRGERADQHGELFFSGSEAQELERIASELQGKLDVVAGLHTPEELRRKRNEKKRRRSKN